VAAHSSAWVRATAPSGAAAYEGVVAWSAELGFGVKPPEASQTAELAAAIDPEPEAGDHHDAPHDPPTGHH
jgi:NADH-quinone oxidoreductase subunit I